MAFKIYKSATQYNLIISAFKHSIKIQSHLKPSLSLRCQIDNIHIFAKITHTYFHLYNDNIIYNTSSLSNKLTNNQMNVTVYMFYIGNRSISKSISLCTF